MGYVIDLCGKWNLLGSDETGAPFSIDAQVPGCVHTDLKNAGFIGDMFYRDNSKLVQWIEDKDFVYQKSFISFNKNQILSCNIVTARILAKPLIQVIVAGTVNILNIIILNQGSANTYSIKCICI